MADDLSSRMQSLTLREIKIPHPAAFTSLNDDVLAEIFELVVHEANIDNPPRLGSGPEVVISAVCRRWRIIALSTGTLWSYITIRSPLTPHTEMVHEWVYRSRSLPLFITIELHYIQKHIRRDVVYKAVEELKEARPSSAYCQFNGFRGGVTDGNKAITIQDHLALKCIVDVLDICIPYGHRWKKLSISAYGTNILEGALAKLSDCNGAPLLEALELYNGGQKNILLRGGLNFYGGVPRLKQLNLRGVLVPIFYSFEGLTSLSLRQGHDPYPYDHFKAILSSPSHLQNFAIEVAARSMTNTGGSGMLPIALPHLTAMHLSSIDTCTGNAAKIWRLLYLPVLKSLTLTITPTYSTYRVAGDADELALLLDALGEPSEAVISTHSAAPTHLSLTAVPEISNIAHIAELHLVQLYQVPFDHIVRFLAALLSLRTLILGDKVHLSFLSHLYSIYRVFDAPDGGVIIQVKSRERPSACDYLSGAQTHLKKACRNFVPLLPSLKCIVVGSPFNRFIPDFVVFREKLGFKLKRVEFSNLDELDREWVRKRMNLEELGHVVEWI